MRSRSESSRVVQAGKERSGRRRVKLTLNVSQIIPGDWGKAGSGWLARLLLKRIARSGSGGKIHQFLWQGRTCQTRMRDLAIRSDEKPLRVESSSSGWFRAWANRSYPEGKKLLLCISTVRTALADSINKKVETAKRKPPKGGQKERAHREGHGNPAGSVKTFQGRRC
jgi:hypothetical protein